MMTLGPIGFLQPWALAGLAALPVIWWLLRLIPPRPRRIEFPPTRLLKDLEDRQETPRHSPWWLTLLRMLLAAGLIFALARPILHPDRETMTGGGPLLLIVDNGWAAASQWQARTELVSGLIGQAERSGRPVLLVGSAQPREGKLRPVSPSKARQAAAGLVPYPWPPDRKRLAERLKSEFAAAGELSVAWLSDGLDYGSAAAFMDALKSIAGDAERISLARPEDGSAPLWHLVRLNEKGHLVARVSRATRGLRKGELHAFSAKGERLGEAAFELTPAGPAAEARFTLPLEIRNQIFRIEIAGERSAGAVQLLDARSRWRRVGILSGESRELAQPLLSPLYYVRRALSPFAEVHTSGDSNVSSAVTSLLEHNLSVMVLADIGKLVGGTLNELDDWVRRGGTLVRFAGPRLEKGGDALLPTALRRGGRTLGGALSWSTPQRMAAFEDSSPFFGLTISPEIAIRRQVLADPSARTQTNSWARLKDGTPLVSAARKGDGTVILFHVTANSDWSNLPISGLFVEMLRRVVERSNVTSARGAAKKAKTAGSRSSREGGVLAPVQTLDGYGHLGSPPQSAKPLKIDAFEQTVPSPEYPPGFYGPAGAARALNAVRANSVLRGLPSFSGAARGMNYGVDKAVSLKPWLLAAALVLFLADMLAVLLMSTGLRGRGLGRAAAALALAIMIPGAELARAQEAAPSTDAFALEAALKTRLAYVITGDEELDGVSRRGLEGLSKVLKARTAVEPADPMGIRIDRDEIAFFPLLYWPVGRDARALPDTTLAKIDAFMKQGGMILFDTRDYQTALPSGAGGTRGPGADALARLLGKLDIPALEPVPEGHVLTKSFYLLNNFPGRWDGGALWVEARSRDERKQSNRARQSDGVSSILITSNDFAAAWALDDRNRPLYPVVPGGETQREMSFRVGVNIVMYALTGNYKADQVHIPALLERLGQ